MRRPSRESVNTTTRFNPLRRRADVFAVALAMVAFVATWSVGCRPATESVSGPAAGEPTLKIVARAERRAYPGAPPVIPHPALGASCTACHTATGGSTPPLGVAPANPHAESRLAARTTNCRQCHLFVEEQSQFVESQFEPLARATMHGDRAHPTAPPTIPHDVFVRDACLACHSGPAARDEIRCSHSERTNCRQCHVHSDAAIDQPALAGLGD